VIVELDLIIKEGPRALWQQHGTLLYVATCADCQLATPPGHRIDAEDWMDYHDCNE
jgi:hypothetical protein